MYDKVYFLWDDGFPEKFFLVIGGTYNLTVTDIVAEGWCGQGMLQVTLLSDGEYYDCQEDGDQLRRFLLYLGVILSAEITWIENIFTCTFALDPDWGEDEMEVQLLERYHLFLSAAGIEPTPDLVPVIEWQRGDV